MILAPSLPSRRFDPVWSGCQWVLNRVWTLLAPVVSLICLNSSRELASGPPSARAMPSESRQATTLAPPETRTHRLSLSFCAGVTGPLAASAGCSRARQAPVAPAMTVLIKLLRSPERVMLTLPVRGLLRGAHVD